MSTSIIDLTILPTLVAVVRYVVNLLWNSVRRVPATLTRLLAYMWIILTRSLSFLWSALTRLLGSDDSSKNPIVEQADDLLGDGYVLVNPLPEDRAILQPPDDDFPPRGLPMPSIIRPRIVDIPPEWLDPLPGDEGE
ncbi:hypothetical protein F5B21DRAFT_508591 [Xylaria acuta]|nr:hypothetical protein F5B21DRAFT_508591 [Xylaria acuta]